MRRDSGRAILAEREGGEMTGTAYEPITRKRSCWTAAWGLRHCEGFEVDCPLGKLGYVEEVQLDDDGDPEALVVGAEEGRFVVPIAEVLAVDVDREHVRIR